MKIALTEIRKMIQEEVEQMIADGRYASYVPKGGTIPDSARMSQIGHTAANPTDGKSTQAFESVVSLLHQAGLIDDAKTVEKIQNRFLRSSR